MNCLAGCLEGTSPNGVSKYLGSEVVLGRLIRKGVETGVESWRAFGYTVLFPVLGYGDLVALAS